MDFFDVIEEYENKISNEIKRRLFLNLDNQTNFTKFAQSNNVHNKLFEEIAASKPICDLISEKRKKNKKLFILALNTLTNKVNGSFSQVGFDNGYFYSQKTECLYMNQQLTKDIAKEIESLFSRERNKINYHCTNNAIMKMLNPIKMTKRNRYLVNDNLNNSIMNNNHRKNHQENIKESRLNKLKKDNMAQLKKRVNQVIFDDDILMKTNGGKDGKGKNKKRILSCRVVIQDKKG